MRLAPLVLACALACAALAACDLPTDPVPTNPYDPLFDGPRIPTSPDSLRLAASTTTSISLAWTDRSSFETAVVVQRSTGAQTASYTTIATLPPNATSYTDAGLTDTRERRYRVIAVLDGGRAAAPSAPLRLQYLRTTQLLGDVGMNLSGGVFSRTGETVYTVGSAGVVAVDARSGTTLGFLEGSATVVGDLGGESVVTVSSTVGPTARVRTFDRTTSGSDVTLQPGGACTSVAPPTVRLSDDRQTAIALCTGPTGQSRLLGVWAGTGGPPVRTVALPGARTLAVDLSRSGASAVTASVQTGENGREIAGIDVATGTVRWSFRDAAQATTLTAPRFSPDGALLLDADPQTTYVRAAATGAVIASNAIGVGTTVQALSFSPDGRAVAVTYGLFGTVLVARTSDLALTLRLDEIRTSGLRLLDAAGSLVAFRTAAGESDLLRFQAGQSWTVVP